jgi:hypothetical protein
VNKGSEWIHLNTLVIDHQPIANSQQLSSNRFLFPFFARTIANWFKFGKALSPFIVALSGLSCPVQEQEGMKPIALMKRSTAGIE